MSRLLAHAGRGIEPCLAPQPRGARYAPQNFSFPSNIPPPYASQHLPSYPPPSYQDSVAYMASRNVPSGGAGRGAGGFSAAGAAGGAGRGAGAGLPMYPSTFFQALQMQTPMPKYDGQRANIKIVIQELENWCFVHNIEWVLKKSAAERDTEVARLNLSPADRVNQQKTFWLVLHHCFKDEMTAYVSSPDKTVVDWVSKTWEKIVARLRPADTVTAQQLLANLAEAYIFDGEIAEYIAKIRRIMDRLETLGEKQNELMVVTNIYQAIHKYSTRTRDDAEKSWGLFIQSLRFNAPGNQLTLDLIDAHGQPHERHLSQMRKSDTVKFHSYNAAVEQPSSRGPCSYCRGPHRFQDGCDQYNFDKKKRFENQGKSELSRYNNRSKPDHPQPSQSPGRPRFNRFSSRSRSPGSRFPGPRRSTTPNRSAGYNSRGRSFTPERRSREGDNRDRNQSGCFKCGSLRHWHNECPFRGEPNRQHDNSRETERREDRGRSFHADGIRKRDRSRSRDSSHFTDSQIQQLQAMLADTRGNTRRTRFDDCAERTSNSKHSSRDSPHPHPANNNVGGNGPTSNVGPVGLMALDSWARQMNFNPTSCLHIVEPTDTWTPEIPELWPITGDNSTAHTPELTFYCSCEQSAARLEAGLCFHSTCPVCGLQTVPPCPTPFVPVPGGPTFTFNQLRYPSTDALICDGQTRQGVPILAFANGHLDSWNRARTPAEHWFVVDSGSNQHLCSDERFLHRGEILQSSITGIGDAQLSATAHGPLLGRVTDSNARKSDILSWGMFIPTSRVSLFSVIQALLAGNTILHEGHPARGRHGLLLQDTSTFVPFVWCPQTGLFWLPMDHIASTSTAVHSQGVP